MDPSEYLEMVVEEIRKLCPGRSCYPADFREDWMYCLKKQFTPKKAADLLATKYGWLAAPVGKIKGPRGRV